MEDGIINNIIEGEHAFEIATLKGEIEKLRNQVIKYQILLNEIDSNANPDLVSDEESICVEQIRKLKDSSGKRTLTSDEVKKLDILHKNLKLSRGESDRVGSRNHAKQLSIQELEAIAKGK